jgi:hypothetical protein
MGSVEQLLCSPYADSTLLTIVVASSLPNTSGTKNGASVLRSSTCRLAVLCASLSLLLLLPLLLAATACALLLRWLRPPCC